MLHPRQVGEDLHLFWRCAVLAARKFDSYLAATEDSPPNGAERPAPHFSILQLQVHLLEVFNFLDAWGPMLTPFLWPGC